jgi:hypothetical protein
MTKYEHIECIRPKVRSNYQERFVSRHIRQRQGNTLVDLILLPDASVFGRYPTIPISPSFNIACPRPETTIPIGQVQRSMFEGDSTSF